MPAAAPTRSPTERSESPAKDATPLFRPEVMAGEQTQWLGTVLLEPRISSTVFAAAAMLAAAAVLALLFFGSFTRKARINGWLVPQQGMVRIVAPQSGVVTKIHAAEGVRVKKGTPLLALSAEVQSETLGSTREEIAKRIATRRDSMTATKQVQARLFDQQAADLQQRLTGLDAERKHLAQEIALQRDRLRLGDKELARYKQMRERDLITLTRLYSSEQERLNHAARLETLQRSQAVLERERLRVQAELQELPLRRQNQMSETERSIAALEQELAEAEARRQIVIAAPQDGTVTAIQTEPGGAVQPNAPLMSIVPEGAVLQALLFSPSRAIGFVHQGQRVLLRYQAFPYQKFGFYEGVVTSVSRSATSPSELPQQLSGLTSLYGTNEPIYRITVDLKQQTAVAYGEAMPLQPGMQLEADVMIESRRLIEWVLDPLYTLTGRVR